MSAFGTQVLKVPLGDGMMRDLPEGTDEAGLLACAKPAQSTLVSIVRMRFNGGWPRWKGGWPWSYKPVKIRPGSQGLLLVRMFAGHALARFVLAIWVMFLYIPGYGQFGYPDLVEHHISLLDEVAPRKVASCRLTTALLSGGSMVGAIGVLNGAWYTQYERSTFHSFDDSGEWLQMDKAGHFFSAYTLGRWGHAAWDRCGTSSKESILLGGSLGLVFLTGVELLDGTSAGWGFSWTDMAANVAGAGFFMGQEALWKEQRITVKLSAHLTPYAAQRPGLLGESLGERILKDYNGQTIWLSGNLRSFAPKSTIPPWLNVAVGYGAENMLTAFPEPGDGRFRQYYVAPDIDLTRIKSGSALVRTILFVLNGVKVPLPGIEVRSTGRVLFHGLAF